MKTTITDIARDTGLSLATISKYLNHRPVLPENQKLIEESIRRLNYTPNRIAQSLRSRRTSTIAILIPPLEDCLWGNFIYPLESFLRQNGYTSIICTSSPEPEKVKPLALFLLNNQIDGAVAIGGTLNQEALALFRKRRIPVVCIDDTPEPASTDLVSSDNYRSAYLAGSYFVRHNHTRIAFLAGQRASYTTVQRTTGFLDALRAAGISPRPEYHSYGDSTSASAQRQFRELMALPEPPTALFFCSYTSFLGGFMEIMSQNIRIPEDLSVISFENDAIFDTLTPRMTVISQDFAAIGQEAAALLLKRLSEDEEGTPEMRLVKTTFLEGDSVRMLA
ncbi:MAG: LacI family DNA-binding transcriptional regulator [Eubacteriales bacterium]|nr:LacI family DNA-binding transcriptional regulator [Eubacteriales bacterium]